jgi:hypothetical protein
MSIQSIPYPNSHLSLVVGMEHIAHHICREQMRTATDVALMLYHKQHLGFWVEATICLQIHLHPRFGTCSEGDLMMRAKALQA